VPKFTLDETIEPESAMMMDTHDGDVTGILKARVNQNFKIGLLWEGRFKQLLFSIGIILRSNFHYNFGTNKRVFLRLEHRFTEEGSAIPSCWY